MEPMAEESQRLARGGAEDRSGARGRGGGCLLFVVALGVCFFLLRDFTSNTTAALLASLAAVLACGGVYLALGSLRFVFESPWYAGSCVAGVLMLVGAAAALSPAAPGNLLAARLEGWALLEGRLARLEGAIEAGEVDLARKLAARGLGDPAARDGSGTPVLHFARGAEMVAALLEAGLDPDAGDARGHTLLMRSSDVEVARVLLAAGADPNARDDQGFTALMHRRDDSAERVELLLEAGADVHAVNDSGRTVADLVHGPGRALLERHSGGRPLQETGGVTPRGRDDWLAPSPGALGRADASGVSLRGEPLLPGDVGAVSIVVDNPSSEDRVLDVRAVLDSGVLFVAASHEGAVEARGRRGPTSTVRWPWLSLPAGGRGQLELEVLARPDDAVADLEVGDLGLDVRVVDLPGRSEQVLAFSQPRQGPAARAGWDDPRSLLIVALPAALVAVFWLVWGRRRGREAKNEQRSRIGRTIAAGCALLCLWTAGDLLWSMVEPYVRFDEAACEILDQRVLATEVERSRSRRGNQPRVMQPHPLAAVAIDTGEERLVTAGWASGGATRSVHELRAFPIGSTASCWLDPADPRRFTLIRTPSLGGVIGVSLLLVTALALALVAAKLGRGSEAPPG
jgi:hypothetical protein